MAKKSKRPIERKTAAAPSSAPVEFNPDYSNTKKDLKRIAVLATSFVLLLVALSFFLK